MRELFSSVVHNPQVLLGVWPWNFRKMSALILNMLLKSALEDILSPVRNIRAAGEDKIAIMEVTEGLLK